MSAKNQPENDQLILNELKIPGRTGPVSETPKVWGINRAAALDNFPRQGLLCQAGPWAPMNPHDRLVIYKNKTQEILREIVNTGEVNTELQMFVEARHITEGTYTLSYSVTRLGGVAEDSLETQVLVKLTRPGGEDHSEEPGHPNLVMTIPEEILKGGIDEDNVASGVPITIGKPDDKPPYPFAAAGDVIRVSWGGVFVLSAPLTQAQADGAESIIVKIDAATIRNAGDSDDSGLAVVFEVYDLVDNRSSDWSVEQRVLVAVDKTRLVAPLLKEAQNNVLDVDKLGDADGTAQVWVSGTSFKVGDIPILKIRGTPQEGPPVDIEVPGAPLVSVPTTHETKIDNRILRQLAKSQIALSYRLEKADGSADLPAKTQFISVIGEVQRLEAPVALDAKQGALDPLLPQVRIEVPFDASFAAGQVINLFWLGTRPDLEAYLPTLPPRLITQGDYDAKEPLLIIVDKKHLTPIIGGKLELYYQLLTEDSVFNQMDRFQQTRAIRESKHADILQIGEARKELPEPTVDGVVDGALPPDTNGTNLIVGYLKTVKGDEVIYHWEGSKTGMHSDSLKLNDFTAGQPVPFTIKAELIKGNEGGTVKASYELKRAAGGTSYSDTLEFSVGVQYGVPTFTNAPYTIAPAGRLKNVELLLSTSSNNPIPRGKLSLTLPANFTYADGGSGLREFISDDVGRVSVSGVKGTVIPGPYSLSATSGSKTANATVTITGMGPVGSIPVGEGLNGIVVSPDGTRAYVCNEDSETVSVIDTATNRVLTNIPVARFPSGIAVSPDGTRVYVSNSYSKTVAVIDTATDRVLTNIPTESSSTKVVVSPDGTRAYVKNLDAVSVIDTATDQVLTRIPIVDSSYGVALSPDGTRVYVCKYNKSTVSVIDTATDRVVTNFPVGRYPFGVAVSPDGNRAYVTNSGTLTVSVIDTATDQVLTSIPIEGSPYGIACSPDGTRAYACIRRSNKVSVIDTTTDQVVTSIPAGSDPMEIAVSPDGTRAYICNAPDNVVSVIDLTTV